MIDEKIEKELAKLSKKDRQYAKTHLLKYNKGQLIRFLLRDRKENEKATWKENERKW